MNILQSKLGQFFIFQLQWWLCLLSAKHYLQYGYIFALLSLLVIFLMQRFCIKNILMVAAIASIGIVNDSIFMHYQIYLFPNCADCILIPNWLIALWLCFCTWFIAADWVNKNYFLFSLLAVVAGPISYFAGKKMAALAFPQSTFLTLGLIGFDWIMLGLIFVTFRRSIK